MPELPDIELYLHALSPRILNQRLERIRVASPFLVRSFDPPIDQANGKAVDRAAASRQAPGLGARRRAVPRHPLDDRRPLQGPERGAKIPGKVGLAAFDFPELSLILTEAGSQRRASLYLVRGEAALADHDPGGLEVLTSTAEQFGAALTRENHTLKRALTDPHLLSGIGNAYSDEILHAAKMSPMLLTSKLTPEQIEQPARARDRRADEVARRLDRGDGRRVSREGDRVPRRHGGARPLRQTLPGVRHADSAHSVRGQRSELLSDVPDRRQAARRSRPVAIAQGRLAEVARRARADEKRS